MPPLIRSSTPLVNPRYQSLVNYAVGATGLAFVAVLIPWETGRIIGMTVLNGAVYGICNDMIACRDCIQYFTVGHSYDGKKLQKRPLNTLNPNLNALVWGMIATWHVCVIAGAAFALLARIPFHGFARKITSAQLAPYLNISSAIALLVSHIRSRIAEKKMNARPYKKYACVPLNLQSGWEACNVRNTTGYAFISSGGTVLLLAIIAVRFRSLSKSKNILNMQRHKYELLRLIVLMNVAAAATVCTLKVKKWVQGGPPYCLGQRLIHTQLLNCNEYIRGLLRARKQS